MSKDKKDAAYSIDASKIVATTLLGAGLATATFFLSDIALPSDTEWWVHWAMSGASLASYAIGVFASVAELRKTAEVTIKSAIERSDREHAMEIASLKRSVDDLQGALTSANKELDSAKAELDSAKAELDSVKAELEGERAALENEKRKNAELAKRWDDKEKQDETRKVMTRAHNLISMLNRSEARSLRSLVNGNNQLFITDPGTTGLQSLGAIRFIDNTGSYVPGRGRLGYYELDPLWKAYATWNAELLDERADSTGKRTTSDDGGPKEVDGESAS